MVDLSDKLTEDFLTLAATLKDFKQCTGDIVSMFKTFNNSVDEPKYQINSSIYECLNSTFSTWCSQTHNQSRVVSRFLQKSFTYTSKEIQALNEVLLKIIFFSL